MDNNILFVGCFLNYQFVETELISVWTEKLMDSPNGAKTKINYCHLKIILIPKLNRGPCNCYAINLYFTSNILNINILDINGS